MKIKDIRIAWRVAETEVPYDLKSWDSLDEHTRDVLIEFAEECYDMGLKDGRRSIVVPEDPEKKHRGWRWWKKP